MAQVGADGGDEDEEALELAQTDFIAAIQERTFILITLLLNLWRVRDDKTCFCCCFLKLGAFVPALGLLSLLKLYYIKASCSRVEHLLSLW